MASIWQYADSTNTIRNTKEIRVNRSNCKDEHSNSKEDRAIIFYVDKCKLVYKISVSAHKVVCLVKDKQTKGFLKVVYIFVVRFLYGVKKVNQVKSWTFVGPQNHDPTTDVGRNLALCEKIEHREVGRILLYSMGCMASFYFIRKYEYLWKY